MNQSKVSRLPTLEENPESINRNQLNGSKAKQLYSFAQSDRFGNSVMSAAPNKYYDLPDLWASKGKSIGKSGRTDFGKKSFVVPSPGSYEIKSCFQKKNSEGITMGLGRDDVKCKNLFYANQMKSPTSTSYRPQVNFNTRSYSIGQKLQTDNNKWIKQVPGPGNYACLELTNNKNNKYVSKYLSSPTSKFPVDERKGLANKTLAPGPGQYDAQSDFEQGSLFDKPYSTKFGYSKRKGMDKPGNIPGPGSYKVFSQFLH